MGRLDGITVDGTHAEAWIEKQEEDKKTAEIRLVRSEDSRVKRYVRPQQKGLGPPPETKRVSRRTRHLSDRQIRKEYGLMAKPYETIIENVIWAIFENGPLTVKEIYDMVKYKGDISGLSAVVSTVYNYLGPDAANLIERSKLAGSVAFTYLKRPGVEVSVEAAYEKLKLVRQGNARLARLEAQDSKAHNQGSNDTSNDSNEDALEVPTDEVEAAGEGIQKRRSNVLTEAEEAKVAQEKKDTQDYEMVLRRMFKAMQKEKEDGPGVLLELVRTGMKIKIDVSVRYGRIPEGDA